MTQEDQQEDISDLADVYDVLKHDAKLLINDLIEGISMWGHAAYLMFILSILGFYLLIVVLYPSLLLSLPYVSYMLSAIAALCLGIFGLGASLYNLRRYFRLKKTYHALYEASKKLK